MKQKIKLLLIIIIFPTITFTQDLAIGQWRDHLPYSQCISVAEVGDLIYTATPYSLFIFNPDDFSVERLSKVNGLSDVGVSAIAYNNNYTSLVIAYENTNIDLIKNNIIINISDIKRKPILGNKTINDIYFLDQYAYLSCGFGIVVLDLIKNEIKDTYYIGPDGSHINVDDLTSDDTYFYAATEEGIFYAEKANPNLANFEFWTKDTLLNSNGLFINAITLYKDKVFINMHNESTNESHMYYRENNEWHKFDSTNTDQRYNLHASRGKLLASCDAHLDVYPDDDPDSEKVIYTYLVATYPRPQHAIIDKGGYIWIADKFEGLIRNFNDWEFVQIKPTGPSSANVYDMSMQNEKLWVAPGGRDGSWVNIWNNEGVFYFDESTWYNINNDKNPELDTIFDILSIAVNPLNSNQVFAGSWGNGLLEFNNGALHQIYNQGNSTMEFPENSNFLGIAGLDFDEAGNIWMTHTRQSKALSVKKTDGNWYTYDLSPDINEQEVGSMIIDSWGQKWIILPRSNAIVIYNEMGSYGNNNDDQMKTLNINEGNDLSTNFINSLAEDLDGEIWVGTDKGIKVYYSPELAFEINDFYAQTILVEQDGYVQHLLEFEEVTTIAVDGSNRKWIGTSKAGVFLLSEDGTDEILHFTEDNSPLFSNSITKITLNHETGEVFIGTTQGLISYKGTSTMGKETFGDVYAYPNPVRESYNGYIAIKGLVQEADVKITDISGNVVYETIAEGGQAIWNGKNFSGERAQTGVYLVFASNEDGSETLVTKILFIN